MKTCFGCISVGMVLFGSQIEIIRASEPVAMAGVVEKAPAGQFFSTHFLRDPNNGSVIAGLRDPGNRIAGPGRITVVAETTRAPEVNGLPVFKVVSVLPEFWTQPSIWSDAQKLPGAFAGFEKGRPKDFAGAPFTTFRAYEQDNGFPKRGLGIPNSAEVPASLRIEAFSNAREVSVRFNSYAGMKYELRQVANLDDAPQTVSTLEATVDGSVSLSAPRPSVSTGFYFIRATASLLP